MFLSVMVLIVIGMVQGCSSSTETATTTTAATTTTTITTTTTTGASTTTTTSTSTTTTTIGSQVAISGTLSLSGVGAQSFGVGASTVAESYIVVAQSADSGEMKFATTDSSGDFSITVATGESWTLNIIDSNAEYTGPVIMSSMEGHQAAMALMTSTNIDLGDIAINSTSGLISPSEEVTTTLIDTSEVARTDVDGVPVGVGNSGKGTDAEYSGELASGYDTDKDGLPNVFDADNDGDGTIDELDSGSGLLAEAVIGNDNVDAVDLSSQLSLSYNDTNNFNPADNSALFIAINPSTTIVDDVVSVEVTSVSNRYANATLITPSGSSETYPADGTSWAAGGYQLYNVLEGDTVRYIAWINPLTQPQAGDTFVFRLTYNDESYEEFAKMINYSFSTVASLSAYSVGTGESVTAPAQNDSSNPIILSGTTEATFSLNRPVDENVVSIAGFNYSLTVFTYSDISFESSVSSSFPETEVSDDGVGDVEISYTFPTAVGTTEIRAYKVDLDCKSSPGGDQATQYLYLVRE